MSDFQKLRKGANSHNAAELNWTVTKDGISAQLPNGYVVSIKAQELGKLTQQVKELSQAYKSQERVEQVKGLANAPRHTVDPNEQRYGKTPKVSGHNRAFTVTTIKQERSM